MGDEPAVAIEILPNGMEAQEIWGAASGPVVDAVPALPTVEASWMPIERAPSAHEVRVTWIADTVLPAGGPVRIECAINAPAEVFDDRSSAFAALALTQRSELLCPRDVASVALACRERRLRL